MKKTTSILAVIIVMASCKPIYYIQDGITTKDGIKATGPKRKIQAETEGLPVRIISVRYK